MANSSDSIYKYQPLFGSWNIEEEIGEGSFGVVYRVSKEQLGQKYISAVKLITIPSKEQYREAKSTLGTDVNTLHNYFQDIVENIIKEVNILHSLSGNNNILNYHDHNVVERDDKIGWDILIRMEYVSSLPKYLETHSLSKEQVIRLGIDICTALEVCSKKGIIHRDIKDENIFVNEDEVFKLGDFGIARELSGSGRAASMRGTPLYMAPEVYRGEKYDPTVDIYSLGIVLYKLLNNGRMPFMPPFSEVIKYKDSEEALDKRMLGEALPLPINSGKALGRVVLKACDFKAGNRYSTAAEMRRALKDVLDVFSQEDREFTVMQPFNIRNSDLSRNEKYPKVKQGTVGSISKIEAEDPASATEKQYPEKTMSKFSGLSDSTTEAIDKTSSECFVKSENVLQQQFVEVPSHICKRCGAKNAKKFCSICGLVQDEDNWKTRATENISRVNLSESIYEKSSIGEKLEEVPSHICKRCGAKNAKKFCNICGLVQDEDNWKTRATENISRVNLSESILDKSSIGERLGERPSQILDDKDFPINSLSDVATSSIQARQKTFSIVNIIFGILGVAIAFLINAFSKTYDAYIFLGGAVLIRNERVYYEPGFTAYYFVIGSIVLVFGIVAAVFSSRVKTFTREGVAQRELKVARVLNFIAMLLSINIFITAIEFTIIIIQYNPFH